MRPLSLVCAWRRAHTLRLRCRGRIIGPQQHFMVEMEPVMWREGDLFRQRQKEGGQRTVDGVSSSMGSMGLGGKRPKRYDSQAKEEGRTGAAADDDDDEGKTQGDMLRAMRAKNAAATGGAKKDDYRGAANTRLTRK